MKFRYAVVRALLCGSLGGLAACASKPPPVVTAAAEPAKPASPARHARAKPACRVVRVDLPAQRKQALFEQFASQEGAAVPPAVPPARPECRTAAR